MESMLSRGITGAVGTVLVGVRMDSQLSPNTRAFIRRNGVDTILTNMVLNSEDFVWYRVANGGWSPTDTLEVGVMAGDNALNGLYSVAMIVEHNTPEPEPLTDTAVSVTTINYVGNGGAQTVELGTDQLPTALIVMPTSGVNGTEPLWWWESRMGAAQFASAKTNYSRVWPKAGRLHVVHTSTDSYNASGVSYTAIAIFDPAGRYVLPFAVAKPSVDDDYTHALRYPQSGTLATDFTPDFVFGGGAFPTSADADKASLYRGPGHVGDKTAMLASTSLASGADRIQAIGPGTVQFGTVIGGTQGEFAFWAGRVNDGISNARFMAVTSYVGNGAASRNIALDLGNSSPVLTIVVPTTAATKAYRLAGDTTGRKAHDGTALANAITAMTNNQITVGTALNATGVTYDVWAITTGFVPPQ